MFIYVLKLIIQLLNTQNTGVLLYYSSPKFHSLGNTLDVKVLNESLKLM